MIKVKDQDDVETHVILMASCLIECVRVWAYRSVGRRREALKYASWSVVLLRGGGEGIQCASIFFFFFFGGGGGGLQFMVRFTNGELVKNPAPRWPLVYSGKSPPQGSQPGFDG